MLCKKIILAIFLINFSISLLSQTDSPEKLTVTGHIYDAATARPLEGINISVSESSVFTDSTGEFAIEVPHYDVTLNIEGIAYQSKQFYLAGNKNIEVKLNEKAFDSFYENADFYYYNTPIAYSTQSVSVLQARDFAWKNPGTSAESLFDGKLAGLDARARSGVPSIGSNLYIHGPSSVYAGSLPLVIVDGFIYDIGRY